MDKLVKAVGAVLVFLVTLIAMAIGGMIGREGVQHVMQPSKHDLAKALEAGLSKGASEVKATLPQKLDEYTTLVDASSSGNTLTYTYILNTTETQLADNFLDILKPGIAKNACGSKMRASIDFGAVYRYRYQAPSGESLGHLDITEADC